MISDEYMMKAANKMQDAADRMEQVAQSMKCLFEEGYGSNALKRIELLSKET